MKIHLNRGFLSRLDQGPLRIAGLYFLIGSIWILASDRLAAEISPNEYTFTLISTVKGWIYVLITGMLLYWLIKRYIHSLQEAEKRLVHAFSRTMMSIWEWDLPANNLRWSPVLFDIAHINKEDLPGDRSSFNDLIHPEDIDSLMDSARKAMKSEDLFMAEFRIIRPDGEVRWLSNMGKPEIDPANNRLYMVGTVQDITEQKQVEQTLRESEQRYRSLFEGSPVAIWEEDFSEVKRHLDSLKEKGITDFNAYFASHPKAIRKLAASIRILDINAAAFRMYKAESKEELIESTNQFESQGELEQIRSALIAIGEGMSSGCWEGADETVTGEPIEISVSWSIVPGHEQDYSRVIVTTVDGTERKRADMALRESESYIKAVMDNLPLGVAVNSVDPGVNFEYMNDNFPAIYRTTREALADPDAFWESVYEDPDFREEIKKRVLDDCASGDPKRMHWQDVPIEHKGAETAFISAMNTPVPGKPLVISTVWDTTARKQAEENYRNIFENSLHGIFQSTPAGRFIMVNPALARIWSYDSPEDLLASVTDTTSQVYVDPDRRAQHTRLLKEQGGSVTGFEYEAYRKDGTTIWVSENVRSVVDSDGHLLYYEGTVEDISKRKEAEEELQASEERFRQLADNIQEAFWITDVESERELYLSPKAEMIWGKPVEEMMASPKSFMEMILPEDREVITSAAAKHRSGEETDIEYRVQQPDRSIRWVWDRAFPIFNDQGKVTRVVGLAADITKRKQAEEALLVSENRFRVIFENANDAIHIDNGSDEIVAVNSRMCELLGYSREELLKMHVADLQAPEMRQSGNVLKNELAQHGSTLFEGLDIHRDGRRIPVEISVGRIEMPSGDFYVSVVRNITERKEAEQKLRVSEERFRQLADNIQEAFWITDVELNEEVYISPSAERIWGRTVEELMKSPAAFLEMVHPEDRDSVISVLAKQRLGEKTKVEYRIHQPDGSVRWVWDRAFPIFDDSGRVKILTGIVADITERKQAEQIVARSRNLLDLTGKMAKVGGWELDLETQTLSWSDEVYRIHEVDPATLPNVAEAINFYAAEAQPVITAAVQAGIDSGTPWDLELPLITAQDRRIWVRAQGAAERRDGKTVRLYGAFQDITEHKQADEALRNAEARYHLLFEQSPYGVLLLDMETGKAIEANYVVHKQLGYTREEFLGLRISDYETLESPEKTAERMQKIIREGSDDFETSHRTKSGEIRNVHVWVQTLPLGDRVLFYCIFQDITERKLAENALRESEQYLLEAQIIAGLGSYMLDISSGIWKSSAILNQIFGIDETFTYSLEGWLALVHPDWREKMSDYFANEVLGKHGRFDKEYRIVRNNDGAVRWVHGLGELEFDDQNRPVKMHGTIQDITERKQVDQAIRESEALYRQAIEVAGGVPYRQVYDSDGVRINYHFIGEGIRQITGYGPEEFDAALWDSLVQEYHTVEELEGYSLDEAIQKVRSGEIPIWKCEFKIRRRDGETRWVFEAAVELRDEHGVSNGSIGTYQDITERKQAEAALRASEQRYRTLFEDVPISIWEEDFSDAKKYLDSLKDSGVTDFQTYFKTNPEVFLACGTMIRVLNVNRAALKMYDAKTKEDLYKSMEEGLSESEVQHLSSALVAIAEGKINHSWEGTDETVNGEPIMISLSWTVSPGYESDFSKVIVTTIDITERKQAEAENKYQLAELETLYENGLAISSLLEPRQIAQRMVKVIDQKLEWHHAAIRLYDASTDRMELLALNSPGYNNAEMNEQIERINRTINTPDKGLSGWVIRHGEVVRIGNLNLDPRYVETYPGISSGLYVPIKSADEVIGSIAVESEKMDAFTERDEHTLSTLANQAAISFINAHLYLQIQKELDERHQAENEVRKLNIELEQRVVDRTTQIEATKRRLELAAQAGQIGVWEYNLSENKVIWDERMHRIHHIPIGEFDGSSQAWIELIHPEDAEQLQINHQQAVTKNLVINNEYRILWPDGAVRHILSSAVTAFSPDGKPDRLIGINMDITERKQIEQSLRESENYARVLFNAVPDPVSVTEINGSILEINEAFEKQFNQAHNDLIGKHISDLGIYPENELDKRSEYLSEVLQGHLIKPVELDCYVPGDHVHTFELHSYLLKVNGRQLILNTSHDITSHKKAEETQRIAKSEMEHALQIKNEFLANMSHELRTPLNSILGISESLEEQIAGALNEKQLKYIGIVHESGRHLLELINDILDLSKVEAGQMKLEIQPIAVEKLCQASLRMIKELAQKKSLNVSYYPSKNVGVISGDERRLKQSLVNLLTNAVKFTPPGNRIGLDVFGNSEKNEIEFTVWDQGIGIEQTDLKRLFKPFVQLDAALSREYQGTGLGLALVSQMVQLHGGRVHVDSEPGNGSRFTIILPWLPTEQNTMPTVTARLASVPVHEAGKNANRRILLVEDTDVVVQLVSEYLRYKGYEVLLAHNGVDGIEMAIQEHPDLILMDVMMPILNGLEATQNIRMDESLKDTPIIALTSLAMPGDSEKCIAAGMNDYLSKPIQMKHLADMIEKYIGSAGEKSNEK